MSHYSPSSAVPRRAAALSLERFSSLDEERDIEAFQSYLRQLSADALWDIHAHLDTERFPRRAEAVERELSRRRLFFVSPYTGAELTLRDIVSVSFCLALLAAGLRVLGSVPINPHPAEHLPFFTDLAVGSPKAARLLLPAARLAALCGSGVSLLLISEWPPLRSRRSPCAS